MAAQTLASRVERLEQRVTALEQLPVRMDALESQIVQLRIEMRAEFSAIRGEMRAMNDGTIRTLRDEIRAGDEETRRYMRVLHEDVISRIAGLQNGRPQSGQRRKR